MAFLVQNDCPCCRDFLHHCRKCWDAFHNGKRHKDYVPPKYFGQSMVTKDVDEIFVKLKMRFPMPSIMPDETREYKEGEYH